MTIRNLEIFTKVAELGSMSAAAKILYITQPSVSLAIAEIEKAIMENSISENIM